MATHVVILRAEGRGFNAGVDIKEMQRTEGFTALIDANRGCFAAFRAVYECAVPGGRRGQRILRRRRHRPGRQRRRHRGLRRREVRAARGGARRARRGHPPVPAGAPAHDAPAVLHRRHRRRRDPAPLRLGARGGAPRRARRGRVAGGPRHRRQGHPGDPGGQGGAELHRRAAGQLQLPHGAGLHLRAEPGRGLRRAPRRVRRDDEGLEDERQENNSRRRRRRASKAA